MDNKFNVYGMFLNQNNTLLSLATNNGYRIYETHTFKQINEVDENSSPIVYKK